MFSINVFQTASADLQDAYNWYEEQSIGLGERFIKEVDNHFELISDNPYQFAVQFSGQYRFALLRHFPFRIVYAVEESTQSVFVSAIFHTSRDPKGF